MDKAKKREILKRLKDEEVRKFKQSLPMDAAEFGRFFAGVKELLSKQGCDHTDRFAVQI